MATLISFKVCSLIKGFFVESLGISHRLRTLRFFYQLPPWRADRKPAGSSQHKT